MKEEVQRISQLVSEGKLSPEDAADLIDAFYATDKVSEPTQEARQTPPPPPPGTSASHAGGPSGEGEPLRETWRGFLDSVEKLTKEGLETVNWPEVSKHARDSAKKGIDQLKSGIEELSKGKVNIGWLNVNETRTITMPLSLPPGKTLKIENPGVEQQP